ncbi:MAG: IS701 family transposase, partial [Candidatus Poribacteria bacterium]
MWSEAQPHIDSQRGVWVVDDTVLDKPYANKIELAGKHKRVVKGMTLVTLLWTEGQSHIPCDYRIYDKLNDKMSQKDHFRSMITESQERGLSPECVL